MKLPLWFKWCYWGALFAGLSAAVYIHFEQILTSEKSSAGATLFLVWIAVALVPLFSEISIGGVKLKQEVQEAEKRIRGEISSLRSDIRVRMENKTIINLPPPDSELKSLADLAKADIAKQLKQESSALAKTATELQIPDDEIYFFKVRVSLEKEIRRIWRKTVAGTTGAESIPLILTELSQRGRIVPAIANSVRELYAVCSVAVHGEPTTSEQREFVKELGPQLVAVLSSVD